MSEIPVLFSSERKMTMFETKNKVDALEEHLLSMPQLDKSKTHLKEYYSGGMYGRQITIPAGTCLTGMVYKRDHLEIMISGEIRVLSANGELHHYKGYNVIESSAGKRQAGYCIEDTVWITINIAPEDCEDYLAYTACKDFDEYKEFVKGVNREDFAKLLEELNMSEEDMMDQANKNVVIPMPKSFSHIFTADSSLAGRGLYSIVDYQKGSPICPARIGPLCTIAGRYTNHALHPNSKLELIENVLTLVATRAIQAGDEIMLNYRDVIKFRVNGGDL